MKTLDTPYTGKLYKFCFKNIETGEWTLANKKPKHVHIKKAYFGSIFDSHYQYHIRNLVYDSDIKGTSGPNFKHYYTEYQFVCGMIPYFQRELKRAKQYNKMNPDIIRFQDQISEYKKQVAFFKKRKKEIQNSKEYLWETLKA